MVVLISAPDAYVGIVGVADSQAQVQSGGATEGVLSSSTNELLVERLKAFHREHFAPENMILIGINVEHDAVCALAERTLKEILPTPSAAPIT